MLFVFTRRLVMSACLSMCSTLHFFQHFHWAKECGHYVTINIWSKWSLTLFIWVPGQFWSRIEFRGPLKKSVIQLAFGMLNSSRLWGKYVLKITWITFSYGPAEGRLVIKEEIDPLSNWIPITCCLLAFYGPLASW